MVLKTKKPKKSKKMKRQGIGGHGRGARKAGKGSGHRGGIGLAGTGKKADHKKSLIIKKYGNKYFGRGGVTSIKTQKDKRKRINLRDIQEKLQKYISSGIAKPSNSNKGGYEINLKDYKVLGQGEIKNKLIITAQEFSNTAKEKIEKAGGQAIELKNKEEKNKNKKDSEKENKKESKEKTIKEKDKK